jgi:hypothetical protein
MHEIFPDQASHPSHLTETGMKPRMHESFSCREQIMTVPEPRGKKHAAKTLFETVIWIEKVRARGTKPFVNLRACTTVQAVIISPHDYPCMLRQL